MKSIDRFDRTFKRVGRVARNSHIIVDVIKLGTKKGLSKVNPVLVVIDAAVSLIDLGIATLEYKKEKELYKLAEEKLKSIKNEYIQRRKIIEKELEDFELEIDTIAENFVDYIKKEREKLNKHFDVVMEVKESLIILKDLYQDFQKKEEMEKVLELQTLFIELLIK